ncbi:MAG: histidine phosphatase family protein [Clostridia bacterium]|nr:histidine phosphatase family protein [Clostridia bacterium]
MENKQPVLELEIYLIRHAQSNGNAGIKIHEVPTIQDMADPLLTQLGISQAKALGDCLSDIDFDYVYSSALMRAERTATEVINKQKNRQKLRILPFLTENGMGEDYAGATWEELHEINPDASLAPDLPEDTAILCYSDKDDDKALFERAKSTIDYLRSHHADGEKLCVVSHAAFITHIIFYLMGLKEIPVFDINFSNTGITRILFYEPGTNQYGDIIFDYINSTSHLPKDMNSK